MFNVRLAGDSLYVYSQLTLLSLVMSLTCLIVCCPFSCGVSWKRSGTELS